MILKNIFAILLLTTHLFNVAGYSLFFQYFINNSDAQLTQNLDTNHYNDADLIEVKVPLNMPYITNTSGFERVDGDMEINGIQYNYVKRKITTDTLYLLCIPNITKTNLYKAKTNFTKTNSDVPNGKKNTDTLKKGSLANEYRTTTYQYTTIPGVATFNGLSYASFSEGIADTCLATQKQPPRAFANTSLL